ncbi:MAG: 50S ribosomal protein L10 [Thermomicrobiales bacterium]
MPTEKKGETISELEERIGNTTLMILADYRGLTVTDLQGLRGQLRGVGAEFRIAKNTLTRIAANNRGISSLDATLEGPTALVFTGEDIVGPSKVINDFVRTSRILKVKGALLQGKSVGARDVEALATMPPKEVLIATIVGALDSPVTNLVFALDFAVTEFTSLLDARVAQLAGEEAAA